MASVNKVIILGYVGKDPEVKTIPSGTKVASFSVATTDGYVDKKTNQKVETTEWHKLVAWSGLAGIVESYVKKGTQVYIEGKLKTRKWDDKEGKTHYSTEITVDNLVLLGSKGGGNQAAKPATSNPAQPGVNSDEDLPF